MRVSHVAAAAFDDPNLVSCAGLVPVLELAERAGLHDLVAEHVHLTRPGGSNAHLKIPALVAGMVAGADSIDDMDLLRHGAMPRLFAGGRPRRWGRSCGRSPSGTSGSSTRSPAGCWSTWRRGRRCYPEASSSATSTSTTRSSRPTATTSTARRSATPAPAGLDALISTVSTASSAPVVTAARLRKGSTAGMKGAWWLLADTLRTVTALPGTGPVVVRADSAFYSHQILDTCRRHGAHFSITAPLNSSMRQAITTIPATAWTTIQYTNAVWDNDAQRWISTAEVAEISYTAFASSKPKAVTARLLVRRVPDLNPDHQNALFTVYRYHAVFTDSPQPTVEAEAAHRAHAIVEQVIADLKNSALAHLPSGNFWANSAWLVLATIAFNLTRAAGALAGSLHARATTGTLRARLITVPARLARSARRLVLHLPRHWPWSNAWQQLFTAARHGPPAAALR